MKGRLQFLKKLCFSVSFGESFFRCERQYIGAFKELCDTVLDFYYNFEHFQHGWDLNEIDNYKYDINKQKEIHSQFCIIIQCLFAFSDRYCGWKTIYSLHFDAFQTISNNYNKYIDYNITTGKDYQFIDLRPQTKAELRRIYDLILTNPGSTIEKDIVHDMQYPTIDTRLRFAYVKDPYQLLLRLWEI